MDYPHTKRKREVAESQVPSYEQNGGDKVARWEGDEAPPSPVETARAGGGDAGLDKSLSTAPKTGDENWLVAWLKKMGWWGQ